MTENSDLMTSEALAAAIDEFSYDYDTYGYKDACDDREVALAELTDNINQGNVTHIEDWLLGIIKEKDSYSSKAQGLLFNLIMYKQKELLKRFVNNPVDAYAIFQLRDDKDLRDIRFESLSYVQSSGGGIERDNYCLTYTGQLKAAGSTEEKLDLLFYQFNIKRPDDFRGYSLSVSDIIALKRDGKISCHYVDKFGFKALPDFLPDNIQEISSEPSLRASEIASHESSAAIEKPTRQTVTFELDI